MNLNIFDRLRGSGKYAVSVPPMDGPLKPNDVLDSAEVLYTAPHLDNLVQTGERIWLSADKKLLAFSASDEVSEVHEFDSSVSCLAAHGEAVAAGVEAGTIVVRGGAYDGHTIDAIAGRKVVCPTAAVFADEDTLIICLGSQDHSPFNWKRDLLLSRSSGSVWRYRLSSTKAELIADQLAFPSGVAMCRDGTFLVSESWKHRILSVADLGIQVLMDDLPFYPGGISPAANGTYLVCAFAPRRQMVEFILSEKEFVHRMINEVPEPYWMAPSLLSNVSPLEPLQGGQIRHHGVLKAWSPTKSYGLVVEISSKGEILGSLHSRAGKTRHGITSAIEFDGRIVSTSKGGGFLLSSARGEL